MDGVAAEVARQQAGEHAADLDAAVVSLAVFAMCAAPVSFPQLARAVGLDPAATGFADHYSAEIARIIAYLTNTKFD